MNPIFTKMVDAVEAANAAPDDYINSADGLKYCGKCRTPKEAFYPADLQAQGFTKHPVMCKCAAERREREEAERRERWKREAETQRKKMDWQREQEKLQEQTRRAIRDSLYELELILEDKRRRNRTELYEPFFFRRENKAVMLQEAYVSGLIDLLEKYPVKRKVYLTLQKIYSGSGAESAKVLIRYLEQKNKKETPNVWGAAAFAAIGIGQLQGICGEEWKSSFSTMLMLIVVILGLGILYAGLRTHYSVGISQIWIAGILFWLSFLGLITTISDNLFWDADTGIFLAVMVWFESIIWMVILGIRAIVLKIKNRR